jgi:predicted ATP-dependent serine protease
MNEDIRLICAGCGACASHESDRVHGRCHFCGARETVIQERDVTGAWVTIPGQEPLQNGIP